MPYIPGSGGAASGTTASSGGSASTPFAVQATPRSGGGAGAGASAGAGGDGGGSLWREVAVTLAPGRDRYLGAGSFGEVLRGFLRDGTEVAVKLAKEGRHVADLDGELESFKKLAGRVVPGRGRLG